MPNIENKIENSEEFRCFYRSLIGFQIKAVEYVKQGATNKQKIERAEKISTILKMMMTNEDIAQNIQPEPKLLYMSLSGCDEKCWDPATGNCVEC